MAKAKSAKKLAEALLERINTPEQAIALTGKEREQYLKALDQVYGPKEARAWLDLTKPEFHGGPKGISAFRASERGTYGPGVYTTANRREAEQYVKRLDDPASGQVYELATRPKGDYFVAETGDVRTLPAFQKLSKPEQIDVMFNHDARAAFLREQGFSGITETKGRDKYRSTFNSKDIRSTEAAFDPRFKDSPYLMAGVGSPMMAVKPQVETPQELLAKANELYQTRVAEPIANAVRSRLTPDIYNPHTGQTVQTASPVSDFIIDAASDPLTYVEGPVGAAATAAQIAAEFAKPQKKNQGGMVYKINPDLVAKLYKGGKISERTAKLHGYADGGVVTPNPDMAQVPQPMPMQTPVADEQPSFLSRVGQGLAELTGFAPDPILTRAKDLADRKMDERLAAESAAAPITPLSQPQLASMTPEGQVDLETFEKPNPFATPQLAIPQVGGISTESAINRAMQAGAEEGVRTAAAMEGMKQVAEQARLEEEQAIRDQQADFQAKQAEINELARQYGQFQPDRAAAAKKIWDDKTTGQKILAGIGLVFGAMSPDGINRAAQMMTKAIEQDVDNQFKRQDQLGKLIGEKRGLLADAQRIYGDQRTARMAVKKLGLDQLQLEIDKYAAKTKNQTQLANLAIARDQVNNERTKLAGELMKASGQSRELLIPGVGIAPSKEEAKKGRELLGARNKSAELINDLLKFDRSLPGTKASGDAFVIAENLRAALRPIILGPGTVQEKEYERLKSVATDPTQIFQLQNKNKLKRLLDIVNSQVDAEFEGMGLKAPKITLGERAK